MLILKLHLLKRKNRGYVVKEKVERINYLAKKAKDEGLTKEEKQEQLDLRAQYVAAFRANMEATLDNVHLMDEQGNKIKLKKRKMFLN